MQKAWEPTSEKRAIVEDVAVAVGFVRIPMTSKRSKVSIDKDWILPHLIVTTCYVD